MAEAKRQALQRADACHVLPDGAREPGGRLRGDYRSYVVWLNVPCVAGKQMGEATFENAVRCLHNDG